MLYRQSCEKNIFILNAPNFKRDLLLLSLGVFLWNAAVLLMLRRNRLPTTYMSIVELNICHWNFPQILENIFQINHQPNATIFRFIILTFIYSSTRLGRFPAHHQELNDCSSSLWFYLRIVVTAVLCSWSGRPAGRPDHEHSTTVTTIRR
jgi:hypothetical protein